MESGRVHVNIIVKSTKKHSYVLINERVHLYIVYAVTLHQLDQNMCPTLNISGGKMAHCFSTYSLVANS